MLLGNPYQVVRVVGLPCNFNPSLRLKVFSKMQAECNIFITNDDPDRAKILRMLAGIHRITDYRFGDCHTICSIWNMRAQVLRPR